MNRRPFSMTETPPLSAAEGASPASRQPVAAVRHGLVNWQTFSAFADDIKIAHTVFALPFALLSTFLAGAGWPKPGILLLILVCMVSARTVAMSVNRLLDAALDARNPRTARRAIPSGRLSRTFYVAVV